MAGSPHLTTIHHPLRMRRLSVTAVARPTPRVVRVTLDGPDLEGIRSEGPADHVKVFVPAPGAREPRLPELGPDGIRPDPTAPRPIGRDYTPSHEALARGVLELDFVLHEGGHAATWAETAAVGMTVGVAGPRGSHVLTTPMDGFFLIGDETALPAIRNWLRTVPAGVPVTVVAEVADADERQPLTCAGDLEVCWVDRGVGPAESGRPLMAAVARRLPKRAGTYHWAAGEASTARAIRRLLVDEHGVDPHLVETRGYWKRGTEDHQEPHTD